MKESQGRPAQRDCGEAGHGKRAKSFRRENPGEGRLSKAMTRLYCCRLDLRTSQESSLSGHLELAHWLQGDTEPGVFSVHPDLSREPFEGCVQWTSSPLKKTLPLEDLKHMLGQGCQNAS